MTFYRKLFIQAAIIIANLLAISLLLFIFFNIDKGFRFSDEGYYLQGYLDVQPITSSLSHFHKIVSNLFGGQASSISFLRILRLTLIICSSILFTYSITYKTYQRAFTSSLFCPLVLTAMLSSFVFGPQSLSYNSLNQFLITIVASIIIIQIKSNPKISTWLTIPLGVITALTVFIKITTALSLLACFAFLYFFIFKTRKAILLVIVGITSFSLSVLIFDRLFNLNSIEGYLNYFQFINSHAASHDSKMVINTLKYFILQMRWLLVVFALFYVLFFIADKYFKSISSYLFFAFLIPVPFVILFFKLEIYHTLPMLMVMTSWLGYLLSTIDISDLLKRRNVSIVVTIFLLFILPITGAIGSDTGILRNTLMYSAFWVIIPLVVMQNLNFKAEKFSTYAVLMLLFLVAFTYTGFWTRPYRMELLTEATTTINNPYHSNDLIKISNPQKRRFEIIKQKLTQLGYKPGGHLFGLTHNIGNIFFLQGIIPNGLPFSIKSISLYLFNSNIKSNDFARTIFLLEENEVESVKTLFENSNINLDISHQIDVIEELNLFVLYPVNIQIP